MQHPEFTVSQCPLCGDHRLGYAFTGQGSPIARCEGCGLMLRNPQPTDSELAAVYSETYFLGSDAASAALGEETNRLKRRTAAAYLDEIEARLGVDATSRVGLKLLEVGPGLGNLLLEASSRGYDVTGIEYSDSSVRAANARLGQPLVLQGSLGSLTLPENAFDVVVLADVIEHTRDPHADCTRIWHLLRPHGVVFIAVPSLDSWSARLMRERWMEFKLEHLFYFNRSTIRTLLFKTGFEHVDVAAGWKTLSIEYVVQHFERFPVALLSQLGRIVATILPRSLRRRPLRVVASGINVIGSKAARGPQNGRPHRVSVVIPVFNERKTFPVLIERLLTKSMAGVEMEFVIVESNSTDGTREEVRKIESHPHVRVIYEERPQGKGHAVRTGLAHVTGDFVLIQDADLEYDLNDYETVLEPLMAGRAAFVLGARHGMDGRSWKIRHFSDQVLTSTVMNVGHILFTALFNVVYGTRLRDPFTMYKVFRRDCLYGLTLESNRFDLDWELVGKLVRAGYRPLEIPVNYESRSFSEGKKVRLIRDPLTWIRACFKYRFARLRAKPRAR